jgi:hypothetical protein
MMTQDVVIQKLDRAKQALAEASTIQQTKQIVDVASAAEIYAKRQRLGEQTINYAFEIRIEALARLGELLRDTPKATGGEHGGRAKVDGSRKEPSSPTPTLADLGLDKKTSMIAQQLAVMPKEVRRAIATKEITLMEVQRRGKRPAQPPVQRCQCTACGDVHADRRRPMPDTASPSEDPARWTMTTVPTVASLQKPQLPAINGVPKEGQHLSRQDCSTVAAVEMRPPALIFLTDPLARKLAVAWLDCKGDEIMWLSTAGIKPWQRDDAMALCTALWRNHICREGGITDDLALRYITTIATEPLLKRWRRRDKREK